MMGFPRMSAKAISLITGTLLVIFFLATIRLMDGLRCLDIKLDRIEKVLEKERRLSRIEQTTESRNRLKLSNTEQEEKSAIKMEVTMLQRAAHIRTLCQDMRSSKERDDCGLIYESNDPALSQIVKNQFLLDRKTGTTYCYIHKVASSSWMALFARLENNQSFLSWVSNTGSYYRVKARLSSSRNIVIHNTAQIDQFSFMVVRNPFDRILSAYRDRILRADSYQALYHVPIMLTTDTNITKEDIIKDGKVTKFPSFDQFVNYIIRGAMDVHWEAFHQACAPCLIDYDSIIKLENAQPEENYVLKKSGMGYWVAMERKHSSKEGLTKEKRKEFYSTLNCFHIQKLYNMFRMDFLLFQYSLQDFLDDISKKCPRLKV